jgi:predicted transcriptional regulator
MTDWPTIWRGRMRELGLTSRDVDGLADVADGYVAKLLCGMKEPRAATIDKVNAALGLTIHIDVG